MLKFSKAHDVTSFTSPEIAAVQYDPVAKRLFATDGKVVIAVPVDGDQKTVLLMGAEEFAKTVETGKEPKTPKKCAVKFPPVAKVFPKGKRDVIVRLDAVSLRKVAEYAESNCIAGDQTVYLCMDAAPTHKGFSRVDDAVLFFCVAEDAGSSKLVSGVILPDLIEETDFAKVVGLEEAALKPGAAYKPTEGEKPDPEARVAHAMMLLKKLGYSVAEPGAKIAVTKLTPAMADNPPRFNPANIDSVNMLRASVLKADLAEFDRLIELGVDPMRLDCEGNPPAVYAVTECHTDALAHFLANPKFARAIDIPDNSGINALVYTVINGDTALSQQLVAAGASEKIARNILAREDFVAKGYGELDASLDALFPKAIAAKPTAAKGKSIKVTAAAK